MRTLNERLAEALTEKGYSYTYGQVEFVLNSDHYLTDGKAFKNCNSAIIYIPYMIENFLSFRNLSSYESDFNSL